MSALFPDQVIIAEVVVTVSGADVMVVSGSIKSWFSGSGSRRLNSVISSQEIKSKITDMIFR